MADFAVSTVFNSRDRITKAFKRMGKAAGLFGSKSDKAFKRASRSAKRFQSITKSILKAQVLTRGLGLLTQGIGSVTQQFIDFDQAITGAVVRFKDINIKTDDLTARMKQLGAVARKAGSETQFTAAQSAEALNFLAKAGFTSAEAIGSLNTMINLATASGEDFERVTDISSDLLGAFGLNVKDTSQKIKNLTRLNDVLVKSANTANVTIETQFETMKGVAPTAVDLGITLEELAAATALLGGAGIKGSLATTALRNILLNLSTQAPKVVSALNNIGLTVEDLQDKTGRLDLDKTMRGIAEGAKNLKPFARAKIFDALFGKRAIAGASNLIKGVDAMNEFKLSLDNAAGTAKLTAELLRKTLGNRLLALASAATEFGFKIIEAFEFRGKKGIDALTNFIREFDAKPVLIFLERAASFAKELSITMKQLTPLLKLVNKFTKLTNLPFTGAVKLIPFGIENIKRNFQNIFGSNEAETTPPNQREAMARQKVDISGRIDIAGAPTGTTVKPNISGAPAVDMRLVGANP